MKRLLATAAAVLALAGGTVAATAVASGGPPVDANGCVPSETYNPFIPACEPNGTPFTFCHVAGLASDPANYITLTTAIAAAIGQAGHFGENGTPNAGHEQDTVGPCVPPVDPPCEVDCEPPCEVDCEPPPDPTCETDPTLCPPEPPCDETLAGQMLGCDPPVDPPNHHPHPTPDPPPVNGICPEGFGEWRNKCYPADAQEQPDGSIIYGEQG